MKKKPYKIVVKFENSDKTKVTRSFYTADEAFGFLDGVKIANEADGMNGYTYKFFVNGNEKVLIEEEKPLKFSDLGKRK